VQRRGNPSHTCFRECISSHIRNIQFVFAHGSLLETPLSGMCPGYFVFSRSIAKQGDPLVHHTSASPSQQLCTPYSPPAPEVCLVAYADDYNVDKLWGYHCQALACVFNLGQAFSFPSQCTWTCKVAWSLSCTLRSHCLWEPH
jgi:hypothetical protein